MSKKKNGKKRAGSQMRGVHTNAAKQRRQARAQATATGRATGESLGAVLEKFGENLAKIGDAAAKQQAGSPIKPRVKANVISDEIMSTEPELGTIAAEMPLLQRNHDDRTIHWVWEPVPDECTVTAIYHQPFHNIETGGSPDPKLVGMAENSQFSVQISMVESVENFSNFDAKRIAQAMLSAAGWEHVWRAYYGAYKANHGFSPEALAEQIRQRTGWITAPVMGQGVTHPIPSEISGRYSDSGPTMVRCVCKEWADYPVSFPATVKSTVSGPTIKGGEQSVSTVHRLDGPCYTMQSETEHADHVTVNPETGETGETGEIPRPPHNLARGTSDEGGWCASWPTETGCGNCGRTDIKVQADGTLRKHKVNPKK